MAGTSYEYVRRAYGVDPVVGQRVRHTVTKRFGTIVRENKSQGQHVQVRFDDKKFALPCHPTELNYSPDEGESE
jgi:actin-like ATPase involved in cell morphogenesis